MEGLYTLLTVMSMGTVMKSGGWVVIVIVDGK